MKKIKKYDVFIFTFFIILVLLTGCANTNKIEEDSPSEPIKIADHLYEYTLTDDSYWDENIVIKMSEFGCSGIQNGIYRGRNYDWIYADTSICVVHSPISENRPHASVGVADLSFISDEEGNIDWTSVPLKTVDGINDAGVCIQVNVMPYGENGTLTHTETTDDDLNGGEVVRFILDFADSVEDAIKLLENFDIHSEFETYDELHWLISGPTNSLDNTLKTVVVEVFPDGLHICEDFVDDKPIMTNFNISNFDGTIDSIGFGFGYERWQTLNENFDQASSIMGTFNLMEKVYYSKFYDLYDDNFWYSEYNGSNLLDYYDEETLKAKLGDDVYNRYIEKWGAVYYNSKLYDGVKDIQGDTSNTGIIQPLVDEDNILFNTQNNDGLQWISIHTSVYDLENKTLDIRVRESYDHFHFTID